MQFELHNGDKEQIKTNNNGERVRSRGRGGGSYGNCRYNEAVDLVCSKKEDAEIILLHHLQVRTLKRSVAETHNEAAWFLQPFT